MALTLIRDGYHPEAAIELMRQQRGPAAMCNPIFENWLVNKADVDFWRKKLAA
jgi:hypothetical protein